MDLSAIRRLIIIAVCSDDVLLDMLDQRAHSNRNIRFRFKI
jgi:hypothetical protein